MNRFGGKPDRRFAISLVVPVRDEGETIARLLEAIAGQTRRPDEVVFVDGGSKDNTVTLLRVAADQGDLVIRIIEAGEATPGRGRNIGIAATRNDWIALTDAGIRLEATWLEGLEEVSMRDPGLAVVYGNYEPVTESFFERCAALAYVERKKPRPGGFMRGPFVASSLLRREVWKAAGGFPDLRAAEDLMFIEAVGKTGYKIGWAPHATVWWELPKTFTGLVRKFVSYSRHNAIAGRQRFWHYGIARQYALALVPIALALVHKIWWLVLPVGGLFARTGKSIWLKREGRGLWWVLNPFQFVGVTLLILTIDLATFVGWAQAIFGQKASRQQLGAGKRIGAVRPDAVDATPRAKT